MHINGANDSEDIALPDFPAEDPLVVLDDSLVSSSAYRIPKNLLDESMMSNNSFADSPSFMERNVKLLDSEKGLEVIGRQLAKERNVRNGFVLWN